MRLLTASQHQDRLQVRRRLAREGRYALREFLHGRSTLPRVANCGRHRQAGKAVTVGVDEDGNGTFGGLASCGSISACPVCSPVIRQGRAGEIEAATAEHLARGGGLVFVTLTMAHVFGDHLEQLLAVLSGSWRSSQQHASWRADKAGHGVVGFIRSLEITHGANGWHPHLHLLLFTAFPLDDDQVADLGAGIFRRWRDGCDEWGVTALRRGFDAQPVRSAGDVARYVAKVQDEFGNDRGLALEMTRHDLKAGRVRSSRTPFVILADAARAGTDATREMALWREYERATHGRRVIEWSRGLRDLLAVPETTDEALAQAQPAGVSVVATVDRWTWSRVVLPVPGRRAALLTAAEVGGTPLVAALLTRWRRQLLRKTRDAHGEQRATGAGLVSTPKTPGRPGVLGGRR